MSDLERRLVGLRRHADATVFRGVTVTPELRARVVRAAVSARAVAAPAARHQQAPRLRTRWSRRPVARLVPVAAVAAVAAVVAVELWPGAAGAASAALTVKPAGSAFVVSIADPHSLAAAPGVIALAGDAARRVPVEIDTAGSLEYRWSPDGRRLAFGNRGDLFVYDTTTGRTVDVTRTPRRWELLPSWSPDGTMLAFTSRSLDAGEGPPLGAPAGPDWVMTGVHGGRPTVARADGSGYRVLDDVTISAAPSWSPDGRTLAYADDGVLEADVPPAELRRRDGTIRLADVPSGRVRVLTPALGRGPGFVGAASWSPGGGEVAFFFSESDRVPSREETLSDSAPLVRQGWAVLDVTSGAVTRIDAFEAPFVPRGPALWSDDGTLLALLLRQEGAIGEPSELRVVHRDGGTVIALRGLYAHASWEPGAHRLAARDDLLPPAVVLVDADRRSVERLRFDTEIDGVAWRADGVS